MAAKKTTKAAVTAGENRVDTFIPRGQANEEPDLLIAVNGVNYQMPKGKRSNIPESVAWEYKRAMLAQELQDKRIQELIEKAQENKI